MRVGISYSKQREWKTAQLSLMPSSVKLQTITRGTKQSFFLGNRHGPGNVAKATAKLAKFCSVTLFRPKTLHKFMNYRVKKSDKKADYPQFRCDTRPMPQAQSDYRNQLRWSLKTPVDLVQGHDNRAWEGNNPELFRRTERSRQTLFFLL
jgi:hypothetical protein